MNEKKDVLNNLISCTKNIKRKVLDVKRGNIDSDNYFRQTFKPIIDRLNTILENKNSNNNGGNNTSTDQSGSASNGSESNI